MPLNAAAVRVRVRIRVSGNTLTNRIRVSAGNNNNNNVRVFHTGVQTADYITQQRRAVMQVYFIDRLP